MRKSTLTTLEFELINYSGLGLLKNDVDFSIMMKHCIVFNNAIFDSSYDKFPFLLEYRLKEFLSSIQMYIRICLIS